MPKKYGKNVACGMWEDSLIKKKVEVFLQVFQVVGVWRWMRRVKELGVHARECLDGDVVAGWSAAEANSCGEHNAQVERSS